MYTLHYYPDTASTIVSLVLRELAVAFAETRIDRENGALLSPDYRALQPLGKIPAMETPDGPMFETAAILLYLADRHPGLAPAPDSPDRAQFLKWYFFASSNLHPAVLELFYPERTAGPDAAPAVLSHARKRVDTCLALLDKVAATSPDWLSSTRPTILGYYLAVLLRWLITTPPGHPGHVHAGDFPGLRPILAYLETRPAALAVAKAEDLGLLIFTGATG